MYLCILPPGDDFLHPSPGDGALLQADRKLVAGFAAFVKDYSAYAREHHNVTFGEIILTAHKADVLMWLMTCNDRHRPSRARGFSSSFY